MSDLATNARALAIGVGEYAHDGITDLPTTVADAEALAAVLKDPNCCGYPVANVQVVTGLDATLCNIRSALESLVHSSTSRSTVLIYYSGHGGRIQESGVWHTCLCPRDTDPSNLRDTTLSGDEFSSLLAHIPAQRLLVILDACHAAGSADPKALSGSSRWKAGLTDDYYAALSQGSGRVVIASCKPDQYSYVRSQADLSLFTYHLLAALRGQAAVRRDGLVHVLDVFHFVNEAVQRDQPSQVPILKVKDLDLNFPVALERGGKALGLVGSPTGVDSIRDQIVRDPISGGRALSDYLKTLTEWSAKRNEVDLKRTELENVQRDLDLFGPNDNDKAAKNRAIYFLLRVCFEIEQCGSK